MCIQLAMEATCSVVTTVLAWMILRGPSPKSISHKSKSIPKKSKSISKKSKSISQKSKFISQKSKSISKKSKSNTPDSFQGFDEPHCDVTGIVAILNNQGLHDDKLDDITDDVARVQMSVSRMAKAADDNHTESPHRFYCTGQDLELWELV